MATKRSLRTFDEYIQDSIRDPQKAAAYLNAAREDGDSRVFLAALKNVIDVHGGLSELARKSKLNRGNLHRMLTGKSSPRFETVDRVLRATGFDLTIHRMSGEIVHPASRQIDGKKTKSTRSATPLNKSVGKKTSRKRSG